jgi:hypothetical protein
MRTHQSAPMDFTFTKINRVKYPMGVWVCPILDP